MILECRSDVEWKIYAYLNLYKAVEVEPGRGYCGGEGDCGGGG